MNDQMYFAVGMMAGAWVVFLLVILVGAVLMSKKPTHRKAIGTYHPNSITLEEELARR